MRASHEGRGRSRSPAHRRGRGRRAARGRQRGGRRGGLRADVVRGRVAAHRARAPAASCSCTRPGARTTCSTSSWRRPGAGSASATPAELMPIDVTLRRGRRAALQRRARRRAAPTATPLGLAEALERFGTMPLADLTARRRRARPARASRCCRCRPSCSRCWSRSSAPRPSARRSTRPRAAAARRARRSACPSSGDLLERLGAEGPGFLYEGDVAAAVSEWVLERGGLLTPRGPGGYEVVEREPARCALPRPRGAHQPAAVVRRHPDRRRARDARAARAPARRRARSPR